MLKLRDYQTKIIDDVREEIFKGQKKILIESPTGSGKTAIMAHMARTCESQGMSVWFIVHRRELIQQSLKAFAIEGIKPGVICNGWPIRYDAKTQICSIQSMGTRLKHLKKPDLICFDECHHVAAGSWNRVFNAYPDVIITGLTATPERLDGRGLGDYFKAMVRGPSVSWLIESGFLSPYKLYAPPGIDLSGVRSRMGDYVKSDLSQAVDKPTITGDAISEYKKLADGKRAVVFCSSIQHSIHVTDQFNKNGIKAEHVDGETDKPTRDEAIKNFASGKTTVLSNVDLFGEGFDLPAIEVAILLRPTQSLGLYLQQVGRSLRSFPGKSHAIILDHAGNCERHGLPDEPREWNLGGFKRRSGDKGSVRIKVCPKCFAAQSIGHDKCQYCGFVYVTSKSEIKQVDGQLVEVDAAKIKRDRAWQNFRARTYEDFVRIGKERGYQRPEAWARIQLELRDGRRR